MPAVGQRVFLAYWFPVLIWMGLIFLMSTGLGAGENTSRILGPLLNFFFPDVSDETIAALRFVLRKFAHVFEYAVLSGLVWRALARPGTDTLVWDHRWARLTLGMCVLYAASDEFHQTFVDGRVGTPVDVMIDTVGIVSALALIWAGRRRRHRLAKPLG